LKKQKKWAYRCALARGLGGLGRHAEGMMALGVGIAPLVDGSAAEKLEEDVGLVAILSALGSRFCFCFFFCCFCSVFGFS
jgi:hypothetical protein